MKILNELHTEEYKERLKQVTNVKRKSLIEYYLDFILSFNGIMFAVAFMIYRITMFAIRVNANSNLIDSLVIITIIVMGITFGLLGESHYCPYFIRNRELTKFMNQLEETTSWKDCCAVIEHYNKHNNKILKNVCAIRLEHFMTEARSFSLQNCLENAELMDFIPQKERKSVRFIFSDGMNESVLEMACKFKKSDVETDLLRLTNSGLVYEKAI